ncbi:MAG TPA: cytochrome-c peroxidase [Bryobacteraceae bacterium]|nr:cytochrome-c peroxidase [Bryobacteraceae bacterium]
MRADDAALLKKARASFKPIPHEAPQLKGNPATPEKIALGKMLFFEPRLSSSGLISCDSCHNLGLGGVDGLETAVGHGWQKGPRNSPTVLNAVFNIAQFWDGRAKDLQEQAMGPVQAAVEMHSTPERTVTVLRSIPEYVDRFKRAFPGETDPVTFRNMAGAIEVFEATLLTPNSRLDQFLGGRTEALNAKEKAGLDLFLSKGCASCHGGVNLGGTGYFPFGVVEKPGSDVLPPNDKGRFAVTKTASDEYRFKSPSLRNIALTAPYFHSGKVWDLRQAVAIMGTSQVGAKLDDAQIDQIVAFLDALTGDQPKVEYPLLPNRTASTPLPDTRVGITPAHQ